MLRRGRSKFGLLVLCAVALSACSGGGDGILAGSSSSVAAEPGYRLPSNIKLSSIWVPTAAVDLMSAEGTFIRAFYEADYVAVLAPGGVSESFPGFGGAARIGFQYFGGAPIDRPGVVARAVIGLEEQSDGSLRADVCTASSRGGAVTSGEPSNEYLFFRREGVSPPVDQEGARRAPMGKPFGDWYAFDRITKYSTRNDPDVVVPDVRRCGALVSNRSGASSPGWPETGL